MATKYGSISTVFLDDNGARASSPLLIAIDDTETVANLLADAQTAAQDLDAVTDAKIEEVTVAIKFVPIGLKSAPVSGCDITQTGTLNLRQSGNPYVEPIVIPAIAGSLVEGGKIVIDATPIAELITFLTAAHTVITAVGKALAVLTEIKDALFSFRKRRKAISRRTKPV